MKELQLQDLTTEQKLGMSMIAYCWSETSCDADYIENLIKNHSLGGIWVAPRNGENKQLLERLLAAADYPLLSFTDAESGFGDYKIGSHNALGITDNEELAYIFGKVTALGARKNGYNIVCNPVLDMVDARWLCGGNTRAFGSHKERVAKLAAAEARGMHDAGVLTVGKHYPGSSKTGQYIDSHMGETSSDETVEELLAYNLYPYLELMQDGLLDGVMLKHSRFPNIDPDYPASLSSRHIEILRKRGFNGFAMTDALNMMGVVAKYGRKYSAGLAVGNAGAIALPFHGSSETVMQWLRECYEEGIITDEKLDAVVTDVLATQHKVAVMEPKFTDTTPEDVHLFERINKDSVYARCDENIPVALDPEAPHFFAILTETELDIRDSEKVHVDTMKTDWYNPLAIADILTQSFPNSKIGFITEYPTPARVQNFLSECLDCGDVVFITFYKSAAFAGKECFTSRIISMMEAMQVSDRISTVLHYGNPYLIEDLPHIPRILIGTCSSKGVDAGLDVLTGKAGAKGVLTYDVKFK